LNVGAWLLWGFVGTVVLTTSLAVAHGLKLTRMSIPFLLGTMVTADRDRAKIWGFALHFMNGWLFALVYVAAFEAWGAAGPLRGALIGLVHAAFVLCATMPVLPAMHPRMASEAQGPTPLRMLEPPGFCALHYGAATPITVGAAHLVYGAVLGAFYLP
jgi:hypothetical protein